MKKSSKVTLTVVSVVALAACSRRRDPCESSYFEATACADAIRGGGYYYGGTWYPMTYRNPYPYYFDSYRDYVSRGGVVRSAPRGSYSPGPAASGTTHGGFGSTGAAHGVSS